MSTERTVHTAGTEEGERAREREGEMDRQWGYQMLGIYTAEKRKLVKENTGSTGG